ncbi:concanavalin A-like lectin/glucanase [Meira miltonrushii]|uniref:Endo-1,4-beta-xylanase n=1 Tax=Meira miltonrushii TaxID=1280837 RepID=A0A316V2P3_9BASI|nr:concanavalin A-like lectin/glucanase [Meira miltonrushii]PWN31524.1 concanavalin A-like lectin/glucanase [Meira miltonrushii]
MMPSANWLLIFLFGYVYGQTNDSGLQTMPYGWDVSGEYFASVWDSKVKGTYTAKGDKAGTYSFQWQDVDDAIVAKGFITGKTDRVLSYDGTFEVQENGAYLSLYGWSVGSHCVEYYVTDNWGEYAPCGPGPDDVKGTFESDGDLYTFCTTPGGQGCIDGKGESHVQFFSCRHTKRSSGTITFANHVAAWENAGMILGELDSYQVIAVEAYAGSSGSATINVSEGNSTGAVLSGQKNTNGNETTEHNTNQTISNNKKGGDNKTPHHKKNNHKKPHRHRHHRHHYNQLESEE